MLEALLRSENNQWPQWNSEEQLGVVRSAHGQSNQGCKCFTFLVIPLLLAHSLLSPDYKSVHQRDFKVCEIMSFF